MDEGYLKKLKVRYSKLRVFELQEEISKRVAVQKGFVKSTYMRERERERERVENKNNSYIWESNALFSDIFLCLPELS
jgi:hypothetical protein